MSQHNAKRRAARKQGAAGGSQTAYGYFITYNHGGRERLLYAERFSKPKRMTAGSKITITPAAPSPVLDPLTLLALKGWKATDETGEDIGGGQGAFSEADAATPELRESLALLNAHKSLAEKGTRIFRGRPRDGETQAWHKRVVMLKDKKKLSWAAITKHLASLGIYKSIDAVRKAYRRFKKR
ncbi:MAG: hypothetical protein U0793_04130 [Gemmataceae bacterium]